VIDTNYGLGQEVAPLYLLDGKRIDKAEIADIDGVIVGIHVLKAEESLRKGRSYIHSLMTVILEYILRQKAARQ